jgi:hypothetical protein
MLRISSRISLYKQYVRNNTIIQNTLRLERKLMICAELTQIVEIESKKLKKAMWKKESIYIFDMHNLNSQKKEP